MRLDSKIPAAKKERMQIQADAMLTALASKTPTEIDNYIEAQVTSLASAKTVLKKLCYVASYLLKNQLK